MLFRCRQGHNSAEAKRLQVTEVREKVPSPQEVPSLVLPYCLSGPSFSIQKAHGRKKKRKTFISFIIDMKKHTTKTGRSQEIAVALTLINVTVLKMLFPSRAVIVTSVGCSSTFFLAR